MSKSIILGLALVSALGTSNIISAAQFDNYAHVQVYAHMGGRNLAPQNSDAAYYLDLRNGYDFVDMDVNLTSDNQVVIRHDPYLDPNVTRYKSTEQWLSSKDLQLKDMTLSYIQSTFDIGRINPHTHYAHQHSSQIPVDDTRIMGLDEQIKHIQSMQKSFAAKNEANKKPIYFQIELKQDQNTGSGIDYCPLAKNVAQIILDNKLAGPNAGNNRVEVQSFDPNCLKQLQADWKVIQPNTRYPINTAYLEKPQLKEAATLKTIDTIAAEGSKGASEWEPMYIKGITPTQNEINYAHNKGLRVVAWTPNTPDSMRDLISKGVDGIITDQPDILKNLKALHEYQAHQYQTKKF